jgi:hypothetical protein
MQNTETKQFTLNETVKGLAEAIWENKDSCDIIDAYGIENLADLESTLTCEVGDELKYCDFKTFKNYEAEVVDSGGAEGDGAEMFCVFKVTRLSDNEENFIAFFGRYSSWDSSYYDDYHLVEPEEYVAIKWNKK